MTDAGAIRPPVLGKRKNRHHWEAKVVCAMCDSQWTITHEHITLDSDAAWPEADDEENPFPDSDDEKRLHKMSCGGDKEPAHECRHATWPCANCRRDNVICVADVAFRTRLWWSMPEAKPSKRRKLDDAQPVPPEKEEQQEEADNEEVDQQETDPSP